MGAWCVRRRGSLLASRAKSHSSCARCGLGSSEGSIYGHRNIQSRSVSGGCGINGVVVDVVVVEKEEKEEKQGCSNTMSYRRIWWRE